MNQMIRSLLPMFVLIGSNFIERKRYNWRVYGAAFIVITGVVLSVWKNTDFDKIGAVLAFASMVMAAFWTLIAATMLTPEMQWNPTSLLFSMSIPATIMLLPIFFQTEYTGFMERIYDDPKVIGALLGGGAFVAVFYNQLHYFLLIVTSSVHSTIFGNLKIMIVVVLSIIYFRTVETAINLVGIGVGFLGMFIYTFVHYRDKRARAHRPKMSDIELQAPLMKETAEEAIQRVFDDEYESGVL